MESIRWRRVEELFHQAADLPFTARPEFLDTACGTDEQLRREVESLLAADQSDDAMLGAAVARAMERFPPEPATGAELIGKRVGHYLIQDLIGRGGMGTVYRAVRVDDFQMQVAIKIVDQSPGGSGEISRFHLERQVIASLDHPNIARLLDGGTTEDGLPYLVMEYVDGVSIDNWCDAQNLTVRDRLKLFRKLCAAVQYAHEKQIVHRDLKPANVLVTNAGILKLLDFGVARVLNPDFSIKPPGLTVGIAPMTPEYASPEQRRGEPVGIAADVYALGILLYRLLTAQPPYTIDPDMRNANAPICEHEPPAPSTVVADAGLRSELNGDLNDIVLTALRNEPQRRYRSVAAFSEDLERFLTDLPVIARPSTFTYRTRKFFKRHRSQAMTAAAGVALVLAVAAGLNRLGTSPSNPGAAMRSVAVLPLEDLSSRQEHEYVVDGLTDALIGELSRIPALHVISRTSVMPLKGSRRPISEIARTLGVDTLAEGSVLRAGGRIRISIRLIEAAGDRPLWSGSYEGDFRDVLALQTRVAEAIAAEFHVTLSGPKGAGASHSVRMNLDAYDEYLKGRYEYFRGFTRESLDRAVTHFHNVVKLDGNYAPAWAGLANCYYMLSSMYHPPTEMMPKAKAAAIKALEIDRDLGEAHAVLALVRSVYDFERGEADKGFRRALELKPSDALAHLWYGLHLIGMGRFDEGLAEVEAAHKLDPSSPGMAAYSGGALYLARRYGQLIERMGPIADLHPDYHHPHAWLALAYEQNGDWAKAIPHMERAYALYSESESLAQLGHIYATAGRTGEARAVLRKLHDMSRRKYVSSYNLGLVCAGLGESEEAFRHLSRAREDRGEWFAFAGVDPRLEPLRADPRFRHVLRSVGLPEQ